MILPHIKKEIEETYKDVYVKVTGHLHTTFFNCTAEGLHHRENMMNSTFGNLKAKLDTATRQLLETGRFNHLNKEIDKIKLGMIIKFKKEFVHTE